MCSSDLVEAGEAVEADNVVNDFWWWTLPAANQLLCLQPLTPTKAFKLHVLGGGVKSGYTSYTKPALFVSRLTPVPEYIESRTVCGFGTEAGVAVLGAVRQAPAAMEQR